MIESRKVHSIRLRPSPTLLDVNEEVALDEPVCVFVNGEYHVTLIATPDMREELAVGYLHTEGVIESWDDIRSIDVKGYDVHLELNRDVNLREATVGMMNLIVTACGSRPRATTPSLRLPKVESQLQVDAESIVRMISDLNRLSRINMRTGGTHAAMICLSNGDRLAFAEDVGRHNAVDKVIGKMLLSCRDVGNCILINTGRLSGEIVQKVARSGIPIAASMRVPLTSGIRFAEDAGVTLVSLRRGHLKIYTNPQRVKIEPAPIAEQEEKKGVSRE